MKKKEIIKHPSYGMIRFSRVNGHSNFYGSELEQDNYITLTIKGSYLERDLVNERYCEEHRDNKLSLRMTAGQFSELITSLNIGSGVPCTLEYVNGEKVETLEKVESRKEFVHKKFKEEMLEFSATIKEKQSEAIELVKKKTLSKKDVLKLYHNLQYLTQEIDSNIPFFLKCFQEYMEKIVNEAKLEVELHKVNTLNALGLQALDVQQLSLKENGTSKTD